MEHFYQDIEGGAWFLKAYARLLEELPRKIVPTWVEVGVFHGQSLAWLAVECVTRKQKVQIVAVDNFAGWPGVARDAELRASFVRNVAPVAKLLKPALRLLDMDSVHAAAQFMDDECAVVWLDADHSYAAVSADLRAWWPKVMPGGTLGGDDWVYADGGVRHAVETFAKREGLTVELIDGEREGEPWPSWVIRKAVA